MRLLSGPIPSHQFARGCPRERELDVGGRHRGARRDDPARRVHRQVLVLVACHRCRFSSEATAAGDGYFEYGVLDRA
jgi:hypothetical protein